MKTLKALPLILALACAAALVPASVSTAVAQVTNIDVQWAISSIQMAGKRANQVPGIKKVLIPEENAKDLAEIPDNVKKGLDLVPVISFTEVLKPALLKMPEPIEEKADVDVTSTRADSKRKDVIHH